MSDRYSIPRDVVSTLKRAYVELGYFAVGNPIATKRNASELCDRIDTVLSRYHIKGADNDPPRN